MYRPGDERMLYDICLLTGDSGVDASGLYRDPKVRGKPPSYVEPATFALALANVLVRRGAPAESAIRRPWTSTTITRPRTLSAERVIVGVEIR